MSEIKVGTVFGGFDLNNRRVPGMWKVVRIGDEHIYAKLIRDDIRTRFYLGETILFRPETVKERLKDKDFCSRVKLEIEFDVEEDGRHICDLTLHNDSNTLSTAVYGKTKRAALNRALAVIRDELAPETKKVK
jgi:hypothetical protein